MRDCGCEHLWQTQFRIPAGLLGRTYEACPKCGKRRIRLPVGGDYAPGDKEWLQGRSQVWRTGVW